jgi:SPP1 gp7 family putative phage head morphogenesis protein
MSAKWWGHRLLEFRLEGGMVTDIITVPNFNVVPERQLVALSSSNLTTGIKYTDPPNSDYMFEVKGSKKLGLYAILAPYVLYKAGGLGDWSQFCELFGIPFREYKYNPYDSDSRMKVQEAAEAMGSAGYAILPDGSSITIHDTNKSGSKDVFDGLIKTCDEQIAKAILGGTMITDNGSSQAQANVHYAVKNEINLSDIIWMEYMLNWDVKPRLINFGIPLANGQIKFDTTREIPLETRIELDVKLASQIEIAPDYWYKTYGIPEPTGKAKPTAPKKDKTPPPAAAPDGGKKIKLFDAVAGYYTNNHTCTNEVIELADVPNDINQAFDELVNEVYQSKGAVLSENLITRTASFIAEAVTAGYVKSMYTTADVQMIDALLTNTWRFAGFKINAQAKDIAALLVDENGTARTFDAFKAEANKVGVIYNQNWLRTEHQHAINSSQQAAKWVDITRNAEVLPLLQYDTAGDNRVRPAHQALDSIIRPVNDAFWKNHYPPLDFGCRCTVRQLAGGNPTPTDVLGKQVALAGQTRFTNIGLSKEVFPADMPFFDVTKAEAKRIDKVVTKLKQ